MVWIYGKHSVKNALLNQRRKHKKLLTTDVNFVKQYLANVPLTLNIEHITAAKLDNMFPNAVHQNIALETSSAIFYDLNFLQNIKQTKSLIIILDQPNDLQNIGAIIRTAACFNAIALIVPKHKTADLDNPILAKIACGGIEHVTLVALTNIANAIKQLKLLNYWCIGLDSQGKQTIDQYDLQGNTALIIGSEGQGLRSLTIKNCDLLVKIPTNSNFKTLNMANSAAIACYEYQRQLMCNNKKLACS